MNGSGYADLHIHTTASDGLLTPAEAVRLAENLQLSVIAITDHDTIDGVAPALAAARKVAVIPGIEVNTDYGDKGIHILGYYLDVESPILTNRLAELKAARLDRISRMVAKLQANGQAIDLPLVLRFAGSGTVGRPHVARALISRGYATTLPDAFSRYLVVGRPGYVERYKITPAEAVELVRESHGIPVLAHPGSANQDELVPELIRHGLRGIEVYHPDHDGGQVRHYEALAARYGLLRTGGSDAHGPDYQHPTSIGNVKIPVHLVDALHQAREQGDA